MTLRRSLAVRSPAGNSISNTLTASFSSVALPVSAVLGVTVTSTPTVVVQSTGGGGSGGGSGGLSTGAIAGIAVGGAVGGIVLIGGVVMLTKKGASPTRSADPKIEKSAMA